MIRTDVVAAVVVGMLSAKFPLATARVFTGSGQTAPVHVMRTSAKWSAL